MTQAAFFKHIAHKEGQKTTIQNFFSEAFGLTLDKLKISDEEKLCILQKAYRRMQYDRDVALAAVRVKSKEIEELKQVDSVSRQNFQTPHFF